MSEEPLRRGQELLQGGVFVFTRSLPAWKVSDVLKHMLPCSPSSLLLGSHSWPLFFLSEAWPATLVAGCCSAPAPSLLPGDPKQPEETRSASDKWPFVRRSIEVTAEMLLKVICSQKYVIQGKPL